MGRILQKIIGPRARRLEALTAAKENARKVAKENPKARNVRNVKKEGKTRHDRSHETREIHETDPHLVDEMLLVAEDVQAHLALVLLVLKIDLKEFASFITMGSATHRLKTALWHTTQRANSTPLLTVACMVINVYHRTVRKVALWQWDLRSARNKHPLKGTKLLRLHSLHQNLKQKLK